MNKQRLEHLDALDKALAELAEAAQAARDCFIMGDDDLGLAAFNRAISALSKAASQLFSLNRK